LLFAVLLVSVSLGTFSYIHRVKSASGSGHTDLSLTQSKPAGDSPQASASTAPPPDLASLTQQRDSAAAQPNGSDGNATSSARAATQPTETVSAQEAPAYQPQKAAALFDSPTTAPAPMSSSLLAQAQSLVDNGQLLEARGQLNDALNAGNLSPEGAESAKSLLSQINQIVIFSRKKFPDDIYGGSYVVEPGDSLAKIANAHDCTWELLGRINGIDPKHLRSGATIKVIEGPFFGYVDKKRFTFDIYLGGLPGEKSAMFVTSVRVGLGRDDSTPPGTWMIEPHHKLRHPTYYSPRGQGVLQADDPQNPLGGYWIGLTGTDGQAVGKMSYGIHGTIDPDSIGKQSSMGCIRLKADDIALVYDLMVEGKSMVVVR
jgi:lipoprotein-anchoring transpeptidase ErfK/SrfK